ncbi:tetratricopeptide repeat-containing sulfotransferase family protein [Aliiglaciecola lipolytica]|uniref:Protein-tyrosine sulfotransferase n=1 Tax=Aliiglaciecola lipolytica E3 TaxID=1127673 RepID=K6YR92_9ALTE|nr:sulfotransferase [Aliiglaciecola lipolytica]GAC13800.1 protein-tyrosine sulfotransferase [Aliiglaciecola lipolytica E3]
MKFTPRQADEIFESLVSNFQQGKRDRAIQLAVKALNGGLDEPLVLVLAAEFYEQQGRSDEGLSLLKKAIEIAPDEPQVWFCLGTMQVRLGMSEDGLISLTHALKLQPDMLPALISAAAVSYRIGQLTYSLSLNQRLIELEPDNAQAYAVVAAIYARRNNLAKARSFAEKAILLQKNNFTATLTLNRIDLLEGKTEQTLIRINNLLKQSKLNHDEQIAMLDLRADVLDKLNRTAEAFADYELRNQLLRSKWLPRMRVHETESEVDKAKRLVSCIPLLSAETWVTTTQYIETEALCEHVFILSFPRSGTTLLEKALSSHSDVLTLEEVDHVSYFSSQWLKDIESMRVMSQLTTEQIRHFQKYYWQKVKESLDTQLDGKTLIDKLPLHTLSLPVIAKLFPNAKILFALRDPRDVVLSCFRRRFQINPAMFELLDLHTCARFYHEVMNLADISRSLLPIKVLDVKHEDTVQNFKENMQKVLNFIGLNWQKEMQNFTANISDDPRTPSDIQLKAGLNTDGLAQWKRYQNQLEPIVTILEPWVQRFGYTK